jgi:hypothetical protein
MLEVGPGVVRRGPGVRPRLPCASATPSCRYRANNRRTCRTETANTVAASAAVISPRSIRWSTSTRFCSRVVNVTLSFILTG